MIRVLVGVERNIRNVVSEIVGIQRLIYEL